MYVTGKWKVYYANMSDTINNYGKQQLIYVFINKKVNNGCIKYRLKKKAHRIEYKKLNDGHLVVLSDFS